MTERLEHIERDIATALNAGDLARVRRLSKQWSRLYSQLHTATGPISPDGQSGTVVSQFNRMRLLRRVKQRG
ncbi:MAG: hypothetical protein LBV06_09205 [Propionibacteriaceae bacterium]|jgi:hypothetical protein|nr:hypothetical protein [Propionibacteriaceae bacterium]